ncbi:RluA family pseudouridine synthase [Collinsella sp. zg1085]|uniref:RluA family pseudouridine synthase n=1 Tax=Collinsella sp. zg1085 TaxID=2844380 RepID=UPI001C0C4564|nr:RluA family pseudouridine synthase [Collinsella sp. zg1085]QWT17097.1 RluA family pseudouridine synthase [Collinsella sp. zg1085]
MPVLEGLVYPEHDGMRLDSFLATLEGVHSRSQAARLIEEGAVTLNGLTCSSKKTSVCTGDRIAVCVPEPLVFNQVQAEAIPLDIRFEDEHLIVLSKPRGLVCHPAQGHVSGTLANALVHHCGLDHLGTLQGEDRPGIVHRLDRDTSGLMLAAKSDEAQVALQNLIRTRTLDRRYITLVHGGLSLAEGTINTGIARSSKDRLRMAVSDDPAARQAITSFRVLEHFASQRGDEGYTLVECHLFTGRTHQIRVHMHHIGHPLVGDPLYGKGSASMNLGLTRQFLHSWYVAFNHPMSGEPLCFTDMLPWDLAQALDDIRLRSEGTSAVGDDIIPMLGLLD